MTLFLLKISHSTVTVTTTINYDIGTGFLRLQNSYPICHPPNTSMTPYSYDPHCRDQPSNSRCVDREGPNQDSLMMLQIGICGWMAPTFLPLDPLESDHCACAGHQILPAYLIVAQQATPKLQRFKATTAFSHLTVLWVGNSERTR